MYQYDKSAKVSSKKKLLWIAAPVVLLAILSVAFVYRHYHKPTTTTTPTQQTDPFSPQPQTPESTDADKKAGDDQKQAIQKDGSAAPTPAPAGSAKKSVKPIITSASGSSVNAFVPDINENDGTCTLSLTKTGSAPVSKTQPATSAGQTTSCQPFNLDTSYTGWTATISYSSATAQGSSDGKVVQ